jgi:hypothetical protein
LNGRHDDRDLDLATDLGGLALGAWAPVGQRHGARAGSWAADLLRLAALALVVAACGVAWGKAAGEPFLILRLWCHGLFCVLAPLAIARGAQRRGPSARRWSCSASRPRVRTSGRAASSRTGSR